MCIATISTCCYPYRVLGVTNIQFESSPPKKKSFPHKKVNTHCKSRSDRLRMCPKHMIKKRKDVNKLFLVNVTLTSTNAKNPMSLSIYTVQNFMSPSWCTFEGVILVVVFSPPFFDLNFSPQNNGVTPPTTWWLLPNVLHLHKRLRQHCTWWCWIESLGGSKAKGSLGSQCRWWFYYILISL